MSDDDVQPVLDLLRRNAMQRGGTLLESRSGLPALDAAASTGVHFAVERAKIHSIGSFAMLSDVQRNSAMRYLDRLEALFVMPVPAIMVPRDETVYERNVELDGPMYAFGYSYLTDKLDAETYESLKLPKHSTSRGSGGMFMYETLNFVDGERTVSDIRDWLVAELGDVPLEYVAEYLAALSSIDAIRVAQ